MFKAHVNKPWNVDYFEVYLSEKNFRGGGRTDFKVVNGELVGETVMEGAALAAPLLRLPLDAVQALASALCETLPPDQAVVNHLKDAVNTRDRLLTIVEGLCWPKGDKVMP